MYITKAANPEELKQFSHLRPRGFFASSGCEAFSPDHSYQCTLPADHALPHAAHTPFRQLVAVWDDESKPADQLAAHDRALVVDRKAAELAEQIGSEASACARTALATQRALSDGFAEYARIEFCFILSLLADRIPVARERVESSLRIELLTKVAIRLVDPQSAVPSATSAAFVERLSRWRAAYDARSTVDVVRLWSEEFAARGASGTRPELAARAADIVKSDWASIESQVAVDLLLVAGLLRPKGPQPAPPPSRPSSACPRCSRPSTGMLGMCTECEQLAWRVAEQLAVIVAASSESARDAIVEVFSSVARVESLSALQREILALFYYLSFTQDAANMAPQARDHLRGWLRATIAAQHTRSMRAQGAPPQYELDAAVETLTSFLDQREHEYNAAGAPEFAVCGNLISRQLAIEVPGSSAAIASLLSNVWSAVTSNVSAAALTLRSPPTAGAG